MLDFKSFKKVADDGTTATLHSEQGHKIHIAKNALSPDLRKRLDKLPLHQSDPEEVVQDPTAPLVAMENDNAYLNSTPVTKKDRIDVGKNSLASSSGPTLHDIWNKLTQPGFGITPAGSGPSAEDIAKYGSVDQAVMAKRSQEAGNNAQPMSSPQGDSDILGPVKGLEAHPVAQPSPSPAPQPLAAPMAPSDAFNGVPGYRESAAGIQGTSQALQQQGNTNAGLYQESAQAEKSSADQLKSDLAAKQSDIDAVVKDIRDNHIQPNHYLESMGAGQKISTAIGLILGGIGSGMTGQANPALAFLNNQIERDLDSQKANMAQKHNLFSALQKQYGDTVEASNMFRAIRASTLADQINSSAATSQSALAKSAALSASGALKQQYLPAVIRDSVLKQLNTPKGPQAAQQQDPSQRLLQLKNVGLVDEKQYDQANKEIGIAEKTQAAHAAVDPLIDRSMELQTAASRVGSPFQSGQQLKALRAQLVPLILEASPSKRLTPEAVESEIEPFMAKFTTGKGTAEQLKAGLHNVISTTADTTPMLDGLTKQYGVGKPSFDQKIKVISPDGKSGSIPHSQLQKALSSGYKQIQ